MPRNGLEATFVISRELNSKSWCSCLATTHFAALRSASRPWWPKTVARISPARQEKFQFARLTSRVSAWRSKFLRTRQPGKNASLSIEIVGGRGVSSLIKMILVILAYGLGTLATTLIAARDDK